MVLNPPSKKKAKDQDSNGAVKIRRFQNSDGSAIHELISSIMSVEFAQDASAYPVDDLSNIPVTYGGVGEAFFVAVDGDIIVGTVAIKKEDARHALLRRLFVASKYRNRQIGYQLIDRAIQFCDEVGYDEIVFKTTSRMGKANDICQKCGFVPRAKLQMGSIELLKFSKSLRNHNHSPKH